MIFQNVGIGWRHHWCCSLSMVWVQIPSREEQQTIKVNFYKMFFLMVFVMFPFIFYAVRLFQNSKTARPKVETPTFLYISVVFWSLKIALEEVKLVKYTSYLLCFQVYDISKCWHRLKTPLVLQFINGVSSNPVEGRTKNLTAQKSNSNTAWFNFQTYIYIWTWKHSKYEVYLT
jgi:hypothetical protein